MKTNQISDQNNGQDIPPHRAVRNRGKTLVRGLLADILIAAVLFGSFYIREYGVPFTQKVYAVVSDTESSRLLINQTDAAATADAAVAAAGTDTSNVSGLGSGSGSDTDSTTATATEIQPEDSTEAAGASVTDNTYTSDNLEITVTQYSSGSGSSTITWYVADIQVTDLSILATCFADNAYGQGITDYVLNMASDNNAVLAVNGDYYSEQKNSIVIRNGELYEDADTTLDMCVLYKDGTMVTYSPGEITAADAVAKGAWQAWCFGPALLADDGSTLSSFNTSSHVAETNPRTAIGYYEPGHYCLVVVDGRSPGYSKGMTLAELSQLFEDMGCTQAYNLDGGKSSVMVFNGTVVNQPSEGGREVSDAIIVG